MNKQIFREKLRVYTHTKAGFLTVTALVLALVLLLNVGVSLLTSSNLWFLDLTASTVKNSRTGEKYPTMYELTQVTKDRLASTFASANERRAKEDKEAVKVQILFCADPDLLKSNDSMRYVYYTALKMEKEFPETISVSTTDVWKNPSSMDAYRTNSYSSVYQSDVIIASGTEFRVHSLKSFYTYDEDGSQEPWAYNGEKIFTRSIIAVTQAESPICCLTVGHGEPFATVNGKVVSTAANGEYSAFLGVIESAGFEVQTIDLSTGEIPENCRLMLTFAPLTDFKTPYDGSGTISEADKLSKFLGDAYSYMIFADADTPYLPNLEEFLEEWGIAFGRYNKEALQITSAYSADADGNILIAEYESEALGGSLTEQMRKEGNSPKVLFGNALPLSYSKTYEGQYVLADAQNDIGAYYYGTYFKNNHSRSVYDVFTADGEAILHASDGTPVDPADAKLSAGNHRLMTITRESRTVGEGQGYTTVNDASYVCAFGSTEFCSNAILDSNSYGNTDVLLATLRTVGKEIVALDMIGFRPLYDSEISQSNVTTGEAILTEGAKTAWGTVLILLPALTAAGFGITLMTKRKFRT